MTGKRLTENRLLAGFIGLSITTGIASGIMQLVLPLYALSLHAGDAQVGLIRGIAPLGGLLTTLPVGVLIDRYGSRRVYIVSGLLDVILIVLIPMTPNFGLLLFSLFLEGGTATMRWVSLNTAFIERLTYFGLLKAGWMRASMAIGLNLLGPLLGGFVVGMMSYRIIYGIIGLLILCPICLMPLLKSDRTRSGDPQAAADPSPPLVWLKRLWGNRLLLRISLIQSLAIACYNAFSVFIIVIVVKNLGHPPGTAASIIAGQGVGFVLILFLGGMVSGKVPLSRLYAVCYFMQVLGVAAIGLFDSLGMIWCGSLLLGIGTGLLMSASYSLLASMEGKKGRITGFFYLITGAGAAVGPVFAGMMASAFGSRAAFLVFLPIELPVFLYFVILSAMESQRIRCLPTAQPDADPP